MKFLYPINLSKNEIQNARLHNLATPPSAPFEGQYYWDTTDKKLYIFNGTIWIQTGVSDHNDLSNIGVNTHAQIDSHIADIVSNPHQVNKSQIGLSNVDNIQQMPLNYLDTDTNLTANSNTKVASQRAIKTYVDNKIQGNNWKESCRVATFANVVLSGLQSIDGVNLVDGDRILVWKQTTPSQNGIYIAKSGAWSRADDFNDAEEAYGTTVMVREGVTYADKAFHLVTDSIVSIGTTALTFEKVFDDNIYQAGDGISIVGNVISIDATENYVRTYAFSFGNNSDKSFTIVHNFGTRDIQVSTYFNSTLERVYLNEVRDSINQITLNVEPNTPANNSLRAVITG